jgi:benzoate membrane transport protein
MLQPVLLGLLAAFVGFASSFAVVLQGFASMGATPGAGGLRAGGAVPADGAAGRGLLHRLAHADLHRLVHARRRAAGDQRRAGGRLPAAVGAFLAASLLLILAGLWRPFARAVERIPPAIAAAMLAGVLLDLCLAPVRAVSALPWLALPVVLAWAIMLRVQRLWAVPAAVLVAVGALVLGPGLPGGGAWQAPELTWVTPSFHWGAMVGIALPLFLVTMASQNLPGFAVLSANGYHIQMRPVFLATGAGSFLGGFFGGQLVNLAAITAALCAGPEAHPDPQKPLDRGRLREPGLSRLRAHLGRRGERGRGGAAPADPGRGRAGAAGLAGRGALHRARATRRCACRPS